MDEIRWFRPNGTGELNHLGDFNALYAPEDAAETVTTTSQPRTTGAKLYIRSASPPEVKAGDVIEARGRKAPVVRTPQLWKTRTGLVRGLVVTIQWKEGT